MTHHFRTSAPLPHPTAARAEAPRNRSAAPPSYRGAGVRRGANSGAAEKSGFPHHFRTSIASPDHVEQLARRVADLRPSHRDPERFHEEKSEIVHELHELARFMEAAR